ncbi:glycosyltransferase [bacterium]|nr:glycosyltransferase [bacterium]
MKFSFIIPSYNSQTTIRRNVFSVLSQESFDFVHEVILVDSSDNSKVQELISGFSHPRLRIIILEKKTHPAETRNIGARMATGDVLCFIDSDIELGKQWLANIAKACESGTRIGGGGILISDEQRFKGLPLAQYYLQFNESIASGSMRSQKLVPSGNMYCERKLFLELGGFPELRAAEDTMFCLKAGKITLVWLVPEAVCYHIFREQWSDFLHNQTLLGRYIIIYRRRHFGTWYYRSFWPVLFLPLFLFIKLCRIFSRIFRTRPYHSFMFIYSFPVFLAGFLAWAYGFFQGCFQKDQEPV